MNCQAKNDTSHRDIALDLLVPLGCDFGLYGLFCHISWVLDWIDWIFSCFLKAVSNPAVLSDVSGITEIHASLPFLLLDVRCKIRQ